LFDFRFAKALRAASLSASWKPWARHARVTL
jgi:hypothetical protein